MQVHCCHMFISLLDSIVALCGCVLVFSSLSYTNMYNCFCFGTNVYCLPTKYGNLICYKVYILLLYQVSCVSVFPLVNMRIPIVLCCGAKRVSFTNRLSEYRCYTYLFTMFYASKHSDKRVTQTCMSYCV